MKNIAVFNNSTGVVGVLESLLIDVDLDEIGLEYGLEMIQSIRKSTGVPLIVIYDYVTSCDSPLVIAAKVKAQLRRYTELRTQNCDTVTQYRIIR